VSSKLRTKKWIPKRKKNYISITATNLYPASPTSSGPLRRTSILKNRKSNAYKNLPSSTMVSISKKIRRKARFSSTMTNSRRKTENLWISSWALCPNVANLPKGRISQPSTAIYQWRYSLKEHILTPLETRLWKKCICPRVAIPQPKGNTCGLSVIDFICNELVAYFSLIVKQQQDHCFWLEKCFSFLRQAIKIEKKSEISQFCIGWCLLMYSIDFC